MRGIAILGMGGLALAGCGAVENLSGSGDGPKFSYVTTGIAEEAEPIIGFAVLASSDGEDRALERWDERIGGLVEAPEDIASLSLSPDEAFVAVTYRSGGNWIVEVRDTDTRDIVTLTDEELSAGFGRVCRTSDYLESFRATTLRDLKASGVVGANASASHELDVAHPGNTAAFAYWAGNGNFVAQAGIRAQVRVTDPDDGTELLFNGASDFLTTYALFTHDDGSWEQQDCPANLPPRTAPPEQARALQVDDAGLITLDGKVLIARRNPPGPLVTEEPVVMVSGPWRAE